METSDRLPTQITVVKLILKRTLKPLEKLGDYENKDGKKLDF